MQTFRQKNVMISHFSAYLRNFFAMIVQAYIRLASVERSTEGNLSRWLGQKSQIFLVVPPYVFKLIIWRLVTNGWNELKKHSFLTWKGLLFNTKSTAFWTEKDSLKVMLLLFTFVYHYYFCHDSYRKWMDYKHLPPPFSLYCSVNYRKFGTMERIIAFFNSFYYFCGGNSP